MDIVDMMAGIESKYEPVANAYEISDYTVFTEKEPGADPEKVAALVEMFKEKKILDPIIINKAGEIMDGQARFEALKQLGRPVKYVFCRRFVEGLRGLTA